MQTLRRSAWTGPLCPLQVDPRPRASPRLAHRAQSRTACRTQQTGQQVAVPTPCRCRGAHGARQPIDHDDAAPGLAPPSVDQHSAARKPARNGRSVPHPPYSALRISGTYTSFRPGSAFRYKPDAQARIDYRTPALTSQANTRPSGAPTSTAIATTVASQPVPTCSALGATTSEIGISSSDPDSGRTAM